MHEWVDKKRLMITFPKIHFIWIYQVPWWWRNYVATNSSIPKKFHIYLGSSIDHYLGTFAQFNVIFYFRCRFPKKSVLTIKMFINKALQKKFQEELILNFSWFFTRCVEKSQIKNST
jgi:hypothetical protein